MNKIDFVVNELQALLKAMNKDVEKVSWLDTLSFEDKDRYEGKEEFVIVKMCNGCKYKIRVTADNLNGIAADVIMFMSCK